MASISIFACPILHYKRPLTISTTSLNIYKPVLCSSGSTSVALPAIEPLERRSGNYEPSVWSFDHIQSQSSKYTGDDYVARLNTLKEEVKMMIRKTGTLLRNLELVDHLQRLGISYHFKDEISDALEMNYNQYYESQDKWNGMDMNLRALGFRLMRQHGYHVPQEIFLNFMEETQNLKPDIVADMVVVLNMYEASYLLFEDESILDDVRDFTTEYLKENIDKVNGTISTLVIHALELPLHWRASRVEAKWFIQQVYQKTSEMDDTLLELAKLDFNMVQAMHLDDLKHASRWWRKTRWDDKLTFARDRLVEHFMWAVGFSYQPQFSVGRKVIAKVNSMISTIDDIYDVYGTLEELGQFTDIINRWDINAVEELPDYMKICFLGFYNTVNEIAYITLTDTGFFVLPYLTKAWAALVKSYLVEAYWYQSGHTPTLEEYLENASVSIAGPVILTHVNFLTSVSSTDEIIQGMERTEKINHYSSVIFRLADDLGTSSDELARGDVPKAIQCYMNESGVNEDEARDYIKKLMSDYWRKLNKERVRGNSQFLQEFIDYATDIPRMAQFMYSDGDGHGRPDISKSRVDSLFFNPV